MSDHWKPLSPTSIAILSRLRSQIAEISQDIDQHTYSPEYTQPPIIEIIEEIRGGNSGPGDQAKARTAKGFAQ